MDKILVWVSILFIAAVAIYNTYNSSASKSVDPDRIEALLKATKTTQDEFYIQGLYIGGDVNLRAEQVWMKKGSRKLIIKDFNYQDNITGDMAEYDILTGNLKILGGCRIERPAEIRKEFEDDSKDR